MTPLRSAEHRRALGHECRTSLTEILAVEAGTVQCIQLRIVVLRRVAGQHVDRGPGVADGQRRVSGDTLSDGGDRLFQRLGFDHLVDQPRRQCLGGGQEAACEIMSLATAGPVKATSRL